MKNKIELSFQQLERYARLSIPHIFLAALFLFNLVALPFPYLETAKPFFVLMAIYYWSIYRPTLVPPVWCFLLGMLMDFLSATPPGLHALVFVAVQWIVRDQRRFLTGQPYLAIWAAFGLVVLLAAFLEWGLVGLTHMQWSEIKSVFMSVALSFFLFPFVTLVLIYIHRILPVASRVFS